MRDAGQGRATFNRPCEPFRPRRERKDSPLHSAQSTGAATLRQLGASCTDALRSDFYRS